MKKQLNYYLNNSFFFLDIGKKYIHYVVSITHIHFIKINTFKYNLHQIADSYIMKNMINNLF
jgi:hypothetical protein